MNFGRLFILNRRRYVNGITLPNTDLHRLVRLPPISAFLVPRQLGFTLGTTFKPSSEMARKMTFAKVFEPVKIVSGTEKINHSACTLASLGFIVDRIPRLRSGGPLSGPTRFFSNAMIANQAGWVVPSSVENPLDTEKMLLGLDLDVPFSFLGEWMRSSSQSRWVRVVTREICGLAIDFKREGENLPRWPNLQRQINKDRQFHCTSCNMAYTEQKALNRHFLVHMETATTIVTASRKRPHLRSLRDKVPLSPEGPETCVMEVETAPRTSRGDVGAPDLECKSSSRLQCPHCNRDYSSGGWLLRHLKTAHGTEYSGTALPTMTRCLDLHRPDKIIEQGSLAADACASASPVHAGVADVTVSTAKTLTGPVLAGELSCSVCGAHGPRGKPWKTFKTLQNHMAKVHGLNARTGLPSRTRVGKKPV